MHWLQAPKGQRGRRIRIKKNLKFFIKKDEAFNCRFWKYFPDLWLLFLLLFFLFFKKEHSLLILKSKNEKVF